MAPATFRIRGEVKNADRVLIDLGDRIEVATEPGPFERLVVFDKPGELPDPTHRPHRQASGQAIGDGDGDGGADGFALGGPEGHGLGTRVERRQVPETAIFPAPAKGAKNPEQTVKALAGYTIKEAKLGKVTGAAMKNPKVEVAADGKSAKVSGEWAGDPAKGGTETIVQVVFTEERQVRHPDDRLRVGDVPDGRRERRSRCRFRPAPAPGAQRKMQLEFRQAVPGERTQAVGTGRGPEAPVDREARPTDGQREAGRGTRSR